MIRDSLDYWAFVLCVCVGSAFFEAQAIPFIVLTAFPTYAVLLILGVIVIEPKCGDGA